MYVKCKCLVILLAKLKIIPDFSKLWPIMNIVLLL